MRPIDSRSSVPAPAVRDAAAQWFARVHSGEAGAEDLQACKAWRGASPEHDTAYRQVEFAWQATSLAPEPALRSILNRREPAARPVHAVRRRLAFGLAASAALAVAAVAALDTGWWEGAPPYQAQFETARGEQRLETLPDGSVIELNTGTRLDVRLYAGRREVVLRSGEAIFMVAPDADRPFVIDAGLGEVRVTGTRFDVRRDAEALTVAVESGSVRVTTGPWWWRERADLQAGAGVRVDASRRLGAPAPADVAGMTAWRRGRIVFNGIPLAQAVAEMNRYLRHPLVLEDDSLAGLRIAATLSVTDPDAILQALPSIAPLRIVERADGAHVIVRR
ncbi:FecR family protein [Achromobacter deleyi]|uniref:FecR family protein n=1 Tax=Achromobacter deleyi TaxID=1353891 RepID=UPI0014924284|nr:FecR family protein [Achromobacter deleyi]QVQ26759.1 FecR family protein [Achromobacter deleyi]UIP22335.1 FecR family protein [Achromobacter deleyi]